MKKFLVFIIGVSAATYCFAMQKQPVAMRVCLLRHQPVAMRIDAQPTLRKERWISTRGQDLPNLGDSVWITYYNGTPKYVWMIGTQEGATKFVMTDFPAVQYPFWIKKVKASFYEADQPGWGWTDTTITFKIYNDAGDSAIYTSPQIEAQHYSAVTEFDLGADSVKVESGNFWVSFDQVGEDSTPTCLSDSGDVRNHSYVGGPGSWHLLTPEGDTSHYEWSIYAYVAWIVGIEEAAPGKTDFEVKCPPNPIQGPVSIVYTLPAKMHINIGLYDITGRLVVTLEDKLKSSGKHELRLDPAELASGVYFCKFKAGDFNSTKKLVLLK